MSKPVIQIKIEGPQGSGKTELAKTIAWAMRSQMKYKVLTPASSYDLEDSFQFEDEFHIVQIRTRQTRKEVSNG